MVGPRSCSDCLEPLYTIVPKASPSAPPTKKRRCTPLHHLSRWSALAGVAAAASAKAAGHFRPIVIALIIGCPSVSPKKRDCFRHCTRLLTKALLLSLW